MKWQKVQDVALFQVVWFSAAVGAARGFAWPAVVTALVAVVVHAGSSGGTSLLPRLLASGLIGFAVETALVASGTLNYAAAWPSNAMAPVWVIALWIAFATTLTATRLAFGARPILAAVVMGAVMGPLSYLAGERLGALTLSDSRALALVLIAVLWSLALPTLLAIDLWLVPPIRPGVSDAAG